MHTLTIHKPGSARPFVELKEDGKLEMAGSLPHAQTSRLVKLWIDAGSRSTKHTSKSITLQLELQYELVGFTRSLLHLAANFPDLLQSLLMPVRG